MAATSAPFQQKCSVAKITSKGQITVPLKIRRLLGAKAGDKLALSLPQTESKSFGRARRIVSRKIAGLEMGFQNSTAAVKRSFGTCRVC